MILIVWMLLRPRKGLRSDHDDISPRARVAIGVTFLYWT
jgi:hypothetical protein